MLVLTACDNVMSEVSATIPDSVTANMQEDSIAEPPVAQVQSTTLDDDDNIFIERDSSAQYYWRREGNDCVLYALEDNAPLERQLAIFPPMTIDNPYTNNSIIQFGLCGDWLVASVGHYEGSGNYFYGDFVRIKKDGSELTHFYVTDDDTFTIVDDWVYYNY